MIRNDVCTSKCKQTRICYVTLERAIMSPDWAKTGLQNF